MLHLLPTFVSQGVAGRKDVAGEGGVVGRDGASSRSESSNETQWKWIRPEQGDVGAAVRTKRRERADGGASVSRQSWLRVDVYR